MHADAVGKYFAVLPGFLGREHRYVLYTFCAINEHASMQRRASCASPLPMGETTRNSSSVCARSTCVMPIQTAGILRLMGILASVLDASYTGFIPIQVIAPAASCTSGCDELSSPAGRSPS